MMRKLVAMVWTVSVCFLTACSGPGAGRDVLFQVGTVDALLCGAYDGALTMAELRGQGDVGIGTFDALDGEMVVLDGAVYQVRADGHAYAVSDRFTTPFAAVTWFDADTTVALHDVASMGDLSVALDRVLATPNAFYAIRIDGEFEYVKTRSVPAQEKPYPPLAKVAENQPTFEFHSVRGTLVGFRCPAYVKGLNVPGYHLHFLNASRRRGGHVLEVKLKSGSAQVDYTDAFSLKLPHTADFAAADLEKDRQAELHKVEK